VGLGGFLLWQRSASLPAGVTIPAPSQETAHPPVSIKTIQGRELVSRSKVRLRGRVLKTRRYYDAHASVAPMDLLLGWGPMSDSSVIASSTFVLKNRTFRISPEPGPFVHGYHLLPAGREVGLMLGALRPGMLVELKGDRFEIRSGDRTVATLSPEAPEVEGRFLFVEEATVLESPPTISAAELEAWYRQLEERRKQLDPDNARAVKAFNEEAAFYMKLARPQNRL